MYAPNNRPALFLGVICRTRNKRNKLHCNPRVYFITSATQNRFYSISIMLSSKTVNYAIHTSEEKKNIPRASLTTGDTPLALCSSPWQTKTLTPRTTADAPRAAPGRKRIPTFRGRAKQPTAPSPLASGAESRSHGPGIAPTNSSIHPKTARIPPPSSAP